jgi:hypothetical protein
MPEGTPINGSGPPDSDIDAFFRSRGMQTYGEVQKKQEELLPKYEEAQKPVVESVEKARAERDKLTAAPITPPAQPNLQSVPKAPRQEYQDPMKAFGSPAVILATLGSLFTRHPLKVAFNSAAAAMEGYHKGDKEKAELEQKNWQEATEAAIAQNKLELEKYQAAWKETEHNVAERQAKLQAIAAGVKDEVVLAGLKTGNLDLIWKTLEKREQAMDKLVQFQQQEKDRQERLKQGQERIDIERQKLETGYLSDEAIDRMARQYVEAGDTTVKQNVGRGASAGQNLARLNERIAHWQEELKVSPTEQAARTAKFGGEKAYQRTVGSYSARVEVASNEVIQMAPLALESAKKLLGEGSEWVAVNRLIRRFEQGTSDPKYYQFIANNIALKSAYVRAMNPTGVPRIAERMETEAEGLFDKATSYEAYKTVVDQVMREVSASKRAVAAARDETDLEAQLSKIVEGGGKETPTAPPRVINKSDYDKLAPGTVFIGEDGKSYRKP